MSALDAHQDGWSVLDNRRDSDRKKRPRVAVLIPCFNAETDIKRALESLAGNSEQHDIVLVDDGSARPLADVLKPIPSNAAIIRLRQNSGIVKALNVGLSFIATQGYEYAARLDADDWSTPARLARQVAFLDSHTSISLLGTWANVVDQNGKLLFRSQPNPDCVRLLRSLEYRNPVVHSTFMLRVSNVVASGGYNSEFKGSEDYELIRRLGRSDSVAVLPETLTYFQITTGSISSHRLAQVTADIRVKLQYFSPHSIHSYVGLLKTALTIFMPRTWIVLLRSLMPRT